MQVKHFQEMCRFITTYIYKQKEYFVCITVCTLYFSQNRDVCFDHADETIPDVELRFCCNLFYCQRMFKWKKKKEINQSFHPITCLPHLISIIIF